jgi:hypothetical protein
MAIMSRTVIITALGAIKADIIRFGLKDPG